MELRVAILEYESALEAGDLERLEAIWTPSDDQRMELEDLFAGDPIDLEIDWLSVTHGAGLAIVDFDQVLRQGEHTGPKTALTAALTPTPAGGWRIAFLGRRDAPAASPAQGTSAPARAQAVAREGATGPLSWTDPRQRRSVAHLRADLVRRRGGEWVIMKLAPSDGAPGADDPAAGPDAQPQLHAALKEYERAFEERDAARLGQVWLMNPYEREALEELFAWTSMVAIDIDALVTQVDGDRATMDFEQQFTLAGRPRVASLARRAFVRALAASDAQGAWDIRSLR